MATRKPLLKILLSSLFLLVAVPAPTEAFWHSPKTTVEKPVGPLVEIRPGGPQAKPKEGMVKDIGGTILRGGVITFGISMMVGAMKLGLTGLGIPVL